MRQVVPVEGELVEPDAARLVPHVAVDRLHPVLLEREAVGHRLAGRLEREPGRVVAQGIALPVHRAQCNAEPVERRPRQVELRDLRRGCAGAVALHRVVDVADLGAEFREVRDDHRALKGPLDEQQVGAQGVAHRVPRQCSVPGRRIGRGPVGEGGEGAGALAQAGIVEAQSRLGEGALEVAPRDPPVVVRVQGAEQIELAGIGGSPGHLGGRIAIVVDCVGSGQGHGAHRKRPVAEVRP